MPLSSLSFGSKFLRKKDCSGKGRCKHALRQDESTTGEEDWLEDLPSNSSRHHSQNGAHAFTGKTMSATSHPSYEDVTLLSRRTSCPAMPSAIYAEVESTSSDTQPINLSGTPPSQLASFNKGRRSLAQLQGMLSKATMSLDSKTSSSPSRQHSPPLDIVNPLSNRGGSIRSKSPGNASQRDTPEQQCRNPQKSFQLNRRSSAIADMDSGSRRHFAAEAPRRETSLVRLNKDRPLQALNHDSRSRNSSFESVHGVNQGSFRSIRGASGHTSRAASSSDSMSDCSQPNSIGPKLAVGNTESQYHDTPFATSSNQMDEGMTSNPLYASHGPSSGESSPNSGLQYERKGSDGFLGLNDMTSNPLYEQSTPSVFAEGINSRSNGQSLTGGFHRNTPTASSFSARRQAENIYEQTSRSPETSPARRMHRPPKLGQRPGQVAMSFDSIDMPSHRRSVDSASGNLMEMVKPRRYSAQLSSSDELLAPGGARPIYTQRRQFHISSTSSDTCVPSHRFRGSTSSMVSSVSSNGSLASRFQDLPEDDTVIEESEVYGRFTLLEKGTGFRP